MKREKNELNMSTIEEAEQEENSFGARASQKKNMVSVCMTRVRCLQIDLSYFSWYFFFSFSFLFSIHSFV